jgi:NAD+ diphosphatase
MSYIPNVAPPEVLDEPACWFAFCGGQLLAVPAEERVDLPLARTLAEFGLVTVRTQYLGTLRGRHCFSAEIASETEPPVGMGWFGLRRLFGQVDDAQYALAGRAVQIMEWDRTHQFCGACGTPTESRSNERVRVCPACAHAVYPRLAPAVMMLVRKGRHLLLGRSPHFQPGVYSALAGFVEPGETLEACVVREVMEEVGVQVKNLRYFGSQSWPFPHSLMIAFFVDYVSGEIVPQPEEIEDAQWFDVDALPGLPMPISISRRLIDAAIAEIREEAA